MPHSVLPRGRHAAPRDVVEASQRERLLDAMAAAVAQRGYAQTSVADVLRRAGVSRRSFYEHFDNKLACFLAAFDAGADLLLATIDAADDPDPIVAAGARVTAYLQCLQDNPDFARSYLVEVLAAGPEALERRSQVHRRFAEQIRASHERARAVLPELPALGAHRYAACVGATDALVSDHLRAHGPDGLPALGPVVLDVVLALLGAPPD